ncbi:DUF1127 domain-containing protein [Rhizobium mongolense]|uniref:DUF1127 domain-containing protein n=1 Tax=Rhizobium mongolense TaxID=57676 RepID=UPI0034A1FDD3
MHRVPERRDNDISQSTKSFSVMSIWARLERQLELRRARMALLEMSDDQLKDIALSRADAHREAHRRLWD